MSPDVIVIGAVAVSIAFLICLVWLMIRAGSNPKWADISQEVRHQRDKRDLEA